eukprot:473326-Amorphochlora_amoeboformis.AAC.1
MSRSRAVFRRILRQIIQNHLHTDCRPLVNLFCSVRPQQTSYFGLHRVSQVRGDECVSEGFGLVRGRDRVRLGLGFRVWGMEVLPR